MAKITINGITTDPNGSVGGGCDFRRKRFTAIVSVKQSARRRDPGAKSTFEHNRR
jgi:hypothetical protein